MVITVDEIELKYDAPPGTVLPRLEDLPKVAAESDSDEQSLEAEYYDTDDLSLLRAQITLRRRSGGSDAGWHLKLPMGGAARREIQVPLSHRGSGDNPVPGELAALVRVHTRRQALRPVAIIRTKRRRRLLLDEGRHLTSRAGRRRGLGRDTRGFDHDLAMARGRGRADWRRPETAGGHR
jgi:inorganic triphosphatase YgiF